MDTGPEHQSVGAVRRAITEVAATEALSSSDLVALRRALDGLEAEYARLASNRSATELATLARTSIRTANRTVRLGTALSASAELADAVRDGRVGLEQAEVLAPVVEHPKFADYATAFVNSAARLDPSRLRSEVAAWTAAVDLDLVQERASRQRRLRSLVFGVDDDGMTTMRGRFTPEDGAVIRQALSHLVRRGRDDQSNRTLEQRTADALVELCAVYASGDVIGGREGPRLLVTIDADVLLGRRDGVGHIDSGEIITPEAARRLACDCYVSPVLHRTSGEILNVGRDQRTATYGQYKALVVRDRGCVAPGCDRPPGWCQAHHIAWWLEMSGPTDLENLALLCHRHHHLVHDDGWNLSYAQTPDGLDWSLTPPCPDAPSPPLVDDPCLVGVR